MAVAKATLFIRQYHRDWVVDMDLSKCFDRLDHGLIIASISKRVKDGSIWKLIEMFLKGGVMIDHEVEATEIGSPQGGVISPLIANIYLDTLKDKIKAITRRSSPVNLEQVIADLNPILRGFANYFRMANCKGVFEDLASKQEFYPSSLELYFNRSRIRTRTYGSVRGLNRA
jgi:retron-type reverse transcriptase